jgi:hypothetical protein
MPDPVPATPAAEPARAQLPRRPSVSVREAPAEAILAETDFGVFVMPFALVPSLTPAGAFDSPESAGGSGSKKLPASRKLLKYKRDPENKRFPKGFQKASKRLPKISASLGPGRRGGMAACCDGLGGAIRLCSLPPPGPFERPWSKGGLGVARGLPFACNPLISCNRPRIEFPRISLPKGLFAQPPRARRPFGLDGGGAG